MQGNNRTLVIINPASARARRAWPQIKAALAQNGVQFDAHETTRAGDATLRTRMALQREGYGTIAVVGGDGTLSEAASGFFEFEASAAEDGRISHLPSPVKREAALALFPAGTGDDFARGLACGRAPLEEWIEKFIAHSRGQSAPRIVDVIHGRVAAGERQFICLNVATIGLGAEVAARVASQGRAMKHLPGEARFVAAACGALAAWRERRVRVRFDDHEVIEKRTNLLAIANGLYAGGGMMFSPEARTDDGLIDLVLTHDLTRAAILRELPRIHSGGHITNPRVRIFKAKHVVVETEGTENALLVEADGNVRGHTPAEFHVMPDALRVIT
jgi:YegS/Rv2252/BmrU family lipid kinase